VKEKCEAIYLRSSRFKEPSKRHIIFEFSARGEQELIKKIVRKWKGFMESEALQMTATRCFYSKGPRSWCLR
jgi:hypothetical protein